MSSPRQRPTKRSTAAPRSRPSAQSRPSTSREQRTNITFLVLSSLVVCSLLSALVVGLSFSDVIPNLFDRDKTTPTVAVGDQNSDVVSAQQTVVAEDPENVEELLFLANLLTNDNRLQEAIPVFEKAVQLAPKDVDARVTFARALQGGDLMADAEFQYKKALEVEPNNQQANYYLAELYMAADPPRKQEAIPCYQRALASDPTTLIGERSKNQLTTLGAEMMAASPVATPASTPLPVDYGPASPENGG